MSLRRLALPGGQSVQLVRISRIWCSRGLYDDVSYAIRNCRFNGSMVRALLSLRKGWTSQGTYSSLILLDSDEPYKEAMNAGSMVARDDETWHAATSMDATR